MANEINLITCIEEVTKKQIVMKGTTYVYFDTKENVEDEVIAEATTLKAKKETEINAKNLKTLIEKALSCARVVDVDINDNFIGFDADEKSQDRMSRATQTLLTDETMTWRVYDNSEPTVNATILSSALRKAGILMSQLWFCTSEAEVMAIVEADEVWLAKFQEL